MAAQSIKLAPRPPSVGQVRVSCQKAVGNHRMTVAANGKATPTHRSGVASQYAVSNRRAAALDLNGCTICAPSSCDGDPLQDALRTFTGMEIEAPSLARAINDAALRTVLAANRDPLAREVDVYIARPAVAPIEAPFQAFTTEGPEWDEARREGCGSPLELRLLRAIRDTNLPEPDRQQEVRSESGRLITVADFTYPQARLLIYADGLAFHSSLRQRIHDTIQTNELQNMGYRVLRFVGPQITSSPDQCVAQIRQALASNASDA